MNSEEIISDQIDQYLNGLMSEEERLIFEEKINQDAAFASKVNEARLVHDAIYYASLVELKKTIGNDIQKIDYSTGPNWKNISYISAFIITLAGITTYYITPEKSLKDKTTTSISVRQETKREQKNASVITEETDITIPKSNVKKSTSDSTRSSNTGTISYLPSSNIDIPVNKDQTVQLIPNPTKKDTLSNIKKVTPTTPVVPKAICDKVFKINTSASCNDKSNGRIQIEADKSYIYTFTVDQNKQSGYHALYSDLSAGSYNLMITYDKECVYKDKVTVTEKWCGLNEAYSFNPDYNEKWSLKYESGANGTYTIYDPSGNTIFSSTFGNGIAEWTGIDRQGITMPVGVYFAIINYSDGRKEKVELTIIR